jgi:hypothetical protein
LSNLQRLLKPKPTSSPLPRDKKRALDKARELAAAAAERLVIAGQEEDIVILKLGKNGELHVKDYGRTG